MDEDDIYLEAQEEELAKLREEEMKKHCPGCPEWLGDYYMCPFTVCIYVNN